MLVVITDYVIIYIYVLAEIMKKIEYEELNLKTLPKRGLN
jgi:hypothetical protein